MTSEKSNGILNHPPIAYTTAQAPKWAAPSNGTASVAASPTNNAYATRRREGRVDGSGVESGQMFEDVVTPVKPFLSSNITPRSGSRKARLESASSTPNGTASGTPNNARPNSFTEKRETVIPDVRAPSGLGLKISSSGRRSRASSSVLSDGPGSSVSSRPLFERRESATRMTSPESSPMFVYANDVKASMPSRPPVGRPLSKKQGSGHGQSNEGDTPNGRNSSMSSSPTFDEQKPRFFHANATPNDTRYPPRLSNGISSQRPPLQTIYSAHTASSPPRAASPLKEECLPRRSSVSKPSPRRHTRLVSNGGTEIRPVESTFGYTDIARRSSTNSPRQSPRQNGINSHSRSSSVQSAGPSPRRRSSIALSNTAPKLAESTGAASNILSNGALPHSVNPPFATQELPSPKLPAQPPSPTRSSAVGQSKIDQMNELAANARHERKIKDLEISNSSLLDYNRNLERKLRKQNAELRRYRRLSRSGRLLAAPISRTASGKMSLLPEGAEDSADLNSLPDSEDEGNDDEDILSGMSSLSFTSSRPSSPTSRAGRTRFQDPKRPKLDLAAHRVLLLDGQKLNQSINRCLTQSESLITSAKTALAYQARAPTPEKLGGRVLTPDDDDENAVFGQGQGLLSPSSWTRGNPFEHTLGHIGDLDGGLETPDYSKWGPPTEVQTPFAELGDSMALEKLSEATVTDNSDVTEATREIEDNGVDVAAPQLRNAEKSLDSKPNLHELYSDGEISLDGIDDSLDNSSLDAEPRRQDPPPTQELGPPPQPPDAAGNDSPRPSSPSRILYAMRPHDTKPEPVVGNVPGNRGSMQNLAHYLQAFSFFGGTGQVAGLKE